MNLRFSLALADHLRAVGLTPVLTRETGDAQISNAERALLANGLDAAAVVHIHCNGVRGSLRHLAAFRSGSMTIAPGDGHPDPATAEASLELARALHVALLSAGGLRDRGVRRRDDLAGLNWSRVPAAIVELGYLTHVSDERRLTDPHWQDDVARALAGAVLEFAKRTHDTR